ncbi:HNH endonuclease signature motif containing protein [Mesorhizobium sp. BE184]|uniref:HNH endonuclease n=1 Tax=Mesorhizobium sp. BE184 TaxID=2817714 RepID=UPI002861F497|nr:HNH endonuclease signature motif containing protein [Mesorhizobium sp. BE184]MDR7032390.1 5-methylcytosine-specific restriction endonuclease McrA [Mesorhizobium sp. BE184]
MRSVTEWIGRSDDSVPPDSCKLRILDRQEWKCAASGVILDAKGVEFDHIVPLWLGGRNCESNLQALHPSAHSRKTKAEATVRAKINRNRIKRVLKKKSRFAGSRDDWRKKRIDGSVIDRRTGEVL